MGEIVKILPLKKNELNIPSDRVFSVLSENHKIIQIGQTEVKLWP